TEINIPDNVTSIGSYAFYNCSGIKTIELSDAITTISESAFSGRINLGNVELPENLKTIYSDAFYNCDGFTSVVLPNTVTSIGNSAFNE
ncbi:leucine-rich repeat domain-containing protein, partial [Salmonella enterica]|uniref:leucine-rich repeat domain-containing protein n=1 Tax=Salmonella enterica TaxID=28901 RepID=UPI0020C22EEE